MKKTLIYFGLALSLIIAGFLIWNFFLDLSFSQIDKQDIQIISTKMTGQFKSNLIFAFSIGLIPIIYGIVEKLSKLKSWNQGLIVLSTIISCGLLSWQLRIFQINKQIQQLSDFNLGEGIQNTINYKNLNFGIFLLIGFLVGGLISTLIFKRKNNGTYGNTV